MARNTMKLELKGFNELLVKLDELQGDVKAAVTEALDDAGKKIGDDTAQAVEKQNLPAGGKFSTGDTARTVVKNPKTEWSGEVASIGLGFDFGMKGAGGFLIKGYYQNYHGTPRHMAPQKTLNAMYTGKGYMKTIQKDMEKVVVKAIDKKMKG